ncbi:MAG: hypothetical protein IPM35_18265 [Myxococcales bacterium]|nr:hypothetical protein [Myxococcales bacterium]
MSYEAFHRAPLRSGGYREIAIVSRGVDTPVLRVGLFREDGSPAGATLFRVGPEIEILGRGICAARDPELTDCRVVGDIRHSADVSLRVRALRAHGYPAAVGWRRYLISPLRWLGQETRAAGEELDALERAVSQLRTMTAASAAERKTHVQDQVQE